MAATINGRQLGDALLRDLFHRLDAGQTRQQIRAHVKSVQGKGISNETIAALRKTHVRYRRSQGYAITERSRTKLRAAPDAPLTPVSQLPSRIDAEGPRRLAPSRRPNAPRIEGVGQVEVVQFDKVRGGRRTGRSEIRQFRTGEEAPSLEQQVAEASEEAGFDSVPRAALAGGAKFTRLAVLPDIDDL